MSWPVSWPVIMEVSALTALSISLLQNRTSVGVAPFLMLGS